VRGVREDGGCKKVLEMGEEKKSLLGLVVVVLRREEVVVIYMMMVDYACIRNKDKENGSGCRIVWDNDNGDGFEEFCASRE
jgi:hypothetical protein